MSSKDLMKLFKKDDWYLDRVNGSHYHFKHKSKKGLVTVPHSRKDLSIKTFKSFFRQAGLFSSYFYGESFNGARIFNFKT